MRASVLPRRPARPVSARERVVSGALLLLLVGLVGLFALSRGLPGPVGLPMPEASAQPSGPFALTSPAGWPRGEIERYDADTVFEKINGKADAYFALGFVSLEFASYARPDDPSGAYVDAYLYDMGKPIQAYGIYRSQQGTSGTPLQAGDEASAEGAFAFARKDRFYLEVVASDEASAAEAKALAKAIADSLPSTGAPVQDPDWFPRKGLVNVTYVLENCLTVESLTDAFLATYDDAAQVVVAKPEAPEEARDEAQQNFEFLKTLAKFEVVGEYVVGEVHQMWVDELLPSYELLAEVKRRLTEEER